MSRKIFTNCGNLLWIWLFIWADVVGIFGCGGRFFARRGAAAELRARRGAGGGGRGAARAAGARATPPPEPAWSDRRQSARIRSGFQPCARGGAAVRCPPSAACRCPQPPAACRCPLSKQASFAGPQARIITNDKLMTWHDAKPPHAKPPRCHKNRRKTRPF